MKLAVDAWNLADDRRGMGRYVRRVLADWEREGDLEVSLITRKDPAGKRAFDAVWYPWNAMRFDVPGARSVVLFHDAFAFTQPHRDWFARRREQLPIRRAVERANVLSTNSYWSAGELARVFGRDAGDFAVVHPVPDPLWCPHPSHDAQPFVLVVAGPEERKNLPTLFKAFARAFPGGDVVLRIAGNVSAHDAWTLERTTIRAERIKPSDEELRALYSDALAVAIPSSAEGYGIMAVEAMACGAPVVASNAAALPEACDGAALLVPPFDLDAWVFTLERVASDSALRATLREQSLARAARIDRGAPARLTLALLKGAPEVPR